MTKRCVPVLMSAGVVLLAACQQPGEGDQSSASKDDGGSLPPASALQAAENAPPGARIERPEGIMNSPGPGSAGDPGARVMMPADVPGVWRMEMSGAPAVPVLELSSGGAMAFGSVSGLTDWPDGYAEPVNWIYVSPGTLTLMTSAGERVWSGNAVSSDELAGTLASDKKEARLVRAND